MIILVKRRHFIIFQLLTVNVDRKFYMTYDLFTYNYTVVVKYFLKYLIPNLYVLYKSRGSTDRFYSLKF